MIPIATNGRQARPVPLKKRDTAPLALGTGGAVSAAFFSSARSALILAVEVGCAAASVTGSWVTGA